jgi:hypothetical protein
VNGGAGVSHILPPPARFPRVGRLFVSIPVRFLSVVHSFSPVSYGFFDRRLSLLCPTRGEAQSL